MAEIVGKSSTHWNWGHFFMDDVVTLFVKFPRSSVRFAFLGKKIFSPRFCDLQAAEHHRVRFRWTSSSEIGVKDCKPNCYLYQSARLFNEISNRIIVWRGLVTAAPLRHISGIPLTDFIGMTGRHTILVFLTYSNTECYCLQDLGFLFHSFTWLHINCNFTIKS